jgi:general secretion pathway protein N
MIQNKPYSTPGSLWAWACVGACIGCLIALLVIAPARWLAQAIHQASNGHLQLSKTQGSIWAGSAQLALAGSAGSRDAVRLPGRVQWKLLTSWDHVVVQLQAACCTQQPIVVKVTPHWQRLQIALEDGRSSWPVQLFSGLGTPWNTVQLEGELEVVGKGLSAELTPDHLAIDGGLRLEARDLRSRLSSLRPMGSYRLTLSGGASPSFQLETLSGSLQLSGLGHWSGNHLRFDGTASAAPAHEAELSNLLNLIGRRDGALSILTAG